MKTVIASLLVSAAIISGAVYFSRGVEPQPAEEPIQNVYVQDGVQIIEINAKGGYLPLETTAQAGIPTVMKVKTYGTFDCSSALVIPDLNYRKNLPPTGTTEIEVPAQVAGARLQGLCSMGMYNFTVNFI